MKRSTLIFAVLTVFTASFGFNACTNKAVKKNIGLQLYSVREDMSQDPVAALEEIGSMGYSFVEAASYSNGEFYGMPPVEFTSLVEKNGMSFLSSHTGLPLPDSVNFINAMAWWDTCIEAHAEAGVEFIVQPFMDSTGYSSLEGLKRYCDYFNRVGEKCNAKGIRFGYHNHNAEFDSLEGQVIYDYMLQHTDSASVFFQIDLYWIKMGGGNTLDYFTRYPGRFSLWHVKDEKEIGASGTIDFKALYENAPLSGMKYSIVEQEKYTTTPMEGVKQSLDYLLNADFVK